ncbi:hypothetical protein CO660_13015 [Rhizobium sp. L9]|nr:hypothetical protein CO660_13015 [Rhizobium sp. L9]
MAAFAEPLARFVVIGVPFSEVFTALFPSLRSLARVRLQRSLIPDDVVMHLMRAGSVADVFFNDKSNEERSFLLSINFVDNN